MCVCDNNKIDLKIQKLLCEISHELNIHLDVKIFNKSKEIIKHAISNNIDIVLLETDMPEIDGITIGKKLKSLNQNIEIVFLTFNKSYALDAFRIGAAGYVIKPILYYDFKYVFRRVITIVQAYKENHNTALTFNVHRDKKRICQNNILYIEKYKNKCNIKTSEHEFSIYTSIKNLLPKLDDFMWQINQGTIINSKYIDKVHKNEVTLKYGKCVTISRKYLKVVKEKLRV
ncbi:LytR/AlgR family response regulator transcription factor [Clostridium sp. Marseille-P2415]|uniref:LytR/AlgR family response regulator transcription factor n=1 Tax=Clostridium sp. Marseille-P2415 TaxID=1805471 RepID=UPI002286DA51|nr:LytTR family DNA-binding domain-containing protein [Clostridium sp. Marseille-P2415]